MTTLDISNQNNEIASYERMFKYAKFISDSDIIPKHFRGKPSNILIAMSLAKRLDLDFLEIANALYVVNGRPAFTSAFMIARINASGKFKTPLYFETEGSGKNMVVSCSAVNQFDQKCSAVVPMSMAIAEGWDKNPKYKSMPEQMLTYRSAAFFCRKYCPEVLMGNMTTDEVQDVELASNRLLKPVYGVLSEPEPKPEPKPEPQPQPQPKPEPKDLTSLIEEAERWTTEAINIGVDPEAISKINPDLDNEDQVINSIHLLKTICKDRMREISDQVF